jgi:outer membrane protein assembly factor BamB
MNRMYVLTAVGLLLLTVGCDNPDVEDVELASPVGTVHESRKLVPSDAKPGQRFGSSVAISEKYILVGAIGDDHAGEWSGAAYVFDAKTGQQLFKLTASDAKSMEFFGTAVCVLGDKAAIGASNSDNHMGYGAGAIYIYDLLTGEELRRLVPSGISEGDEFGYAVAGEDHRVLVGSPSADIPNHDDGVAYVFDVDSGAQVARLEADSASLGASVALSGDRAVVGTLRGDAYVFDVATGEQTEEIDGAEIEASHRGFGRCVGISGDRVAVAAARADGLYEKTGVVFLFDARNGRLLYELRALDAAPNDELGTSLAMDGERVLAGSEGEHESENPEGRSGAVYLFSANTGIELAKLIPESVAVGDGFGDCVGISDHRAVVGAPGTNDDAGAVYVFDDLP